VQTQPTGNKFTALMAALVNNTVEIGYTVRLVNESGLEALQRRHGRKLFPGRSGGLN
jgi:hypothetical protein